MSQQRAIVLDNGSGILKAGWSGDNIPTVQFDTALGRPILRSTTNPRGSTSVSDVLVGDETVGQTHLLEMSYPVRVGIVQDYDAMTKLWAHAFKKLGATSIGSRVMMSDPPTMSNKARYRLFETFFEKYQVDALQTSPQGVLALYSCALDTGLVVDCGEGVSHCTPIFEGYAIKKANQRVDLGGRNITEFLVRLMQRRGYTFTVGSDFEVVRAIKERFCYSAVDLELERRLALETTVLEKAVTLPDGSTVRIGRERFEATEALFQPILIDMECDGLSEQLWRSIQACDVDLRTAMYGNIILTGGSTMFPGLSSRIERDLTQMFITHSLNGDASRVSRLKLRIDDPPRRKYMTWSGAAALADMTLNDAEHWMMRKDYLDGGESAIRKWFGGAA